MKRYASVIIEISANGLDRPFTYTVPDAFSDIIDIGSVVVIPFGAANRMMTGYVVDFPQSTSIDPSRLKDIESINSSVNVESDLIKLANWMQKRYLCSLQSALKTMVPSSQEINKKFDRYVQRVAGMEEIKGMLDNMPDSPRYESRRRLLQYFTQHETAAEDALIEAAQTTKSVIKGQIEKGILVYVDKEAYRNPYDHEKIERTQNHIPNYLQQKAIFQIETAIHHKTPDIFLLHGVTGSGKTEVYMQAIDRALADHRQAIVLIPEIALTPQTVNRFIGRFGDTVGVLHSRLSKGEKYDQWRKAKEGKIKIMIGPRSAIFAPFDNLGVIIIDEEHEATYKSEMLPKYNAREVAIKRGSMSSCPIVLGSATPLVETYYKALEGKYKLLKLTQKAVKDANLSVEIVDMRKELDSGNKTMLSRSLHAAIDGALEHGEQVILFLNRRGHSSFVSCRKCGIVIKCPSCDLPYTYHSDGEKLICHYCSKTVKKPKICPKCGSQYIKEFGIGTQKVENYIRQAFPKATVVRMDMDTTSNKNAHERILDQVEQGKADILIGTQMVAKGHHFENVTVVGVIAADMSLFVNDFRACERTFQLVTQVTGRTGRGGKPGKAYIQTYSPDHYSLVSAMNQDYEAFYENEIKFRKVMGYPPFTNIAIMLVSGSDENRLIEDMKHIRDFLYQFKDERVKMLGPSPASLSKLKNSYRWRIIFKSQDYRVLNHMLQTISDRIYKENLWQHLTIQYDINPMMSY